MPILLPTPDNPNTPTSPSNPDQPGIPESGKYAAN